MAKSCFQCPDIEPHVYGKSNCNGDCEWNDWQKVCKGKYMLDKVLICR